MLTFLDLQGEVKRRGTRDQAGTDYDTAVDNAINTSLFRIAREAAWRGLRRTATFNTITTYSEGSGAVAVTEDSTAVTVTGATFLTDAVKPGRYIKFSGSSTYFKIVTITGETTLTIDQVYDGDDATDATYEILPQEEYLLPIQASHRMFLWHREWGYPTQMNYSPEQSFYSSGVDDILEGIPTDYHMWGEDMVRSQPLAGSVLRISSSSAADISIDVMVFGTVGGYPDYEKITTNAANGTTAVSGSKTFTHVERIAKDANTTGRITIDSNSAGNTVAVLPTSDTTAGIMYRKIKLHPLPDTVFPVNVYYYKDPYRLVNDEDVHELGQEFDEAIILLAVSKIKFETNQDEGTKWFQLYKDELKSLRKTNVDKIDWGMKLERPYMNGGAGNFISPTLQYRQIGPYYGRTI